jgi:hypothetical protein
VAAALRPGGLDQDYKQDYKKETQMLTPADHCEIHQLYARCNHAIDTDDASGWAETFTEDGTFSDGPLNLSGREAMKVFVQGRPERLRAQGVRRKQHWISNLVIEAEGKDEARGRCYVQILGEPADGSGVRVDKIGTYADVLVKRSGRWLIRSRIGG